MPILQILNSVLNTRLIQYLLVLCLITLTGLTIFYKLKLSSIQLISEQRKNAIVELEFNLQQQNAKILEYNDKLLIQEQNLKDAQAKASKIALESNKTLQGILGYEFSSDCDSSVQEALNLIRNKK